MIKLFQLKYVYLVFFFVKPSSMFHVVWSRVFGLRRTHMQDLKEVTDTIHYESYRRKRLTEEKHDHIVLQNNVVNMDDINCQESKI